MLVGECTRKKRRNVLIRNVVRSLLQKFTTPSIALRSVDGLLPIKIFLQIITRKKNNKNKKRICKTPNCNTILSRYNKEKICENCKRERYIKRLMSWGWSEKQARGEDI